MKQFPMTFIFLTLLLGGLYGEKDAAQGGFSTSLVKFLSFSEDDTPTKPWITGSGSFGADATFWWLDDSFSANLIEMETIRDTPIFYKFNIHIDDLFGLKASANLFLDKLLNPLGIFSPDFSLGLAGSSGGAQTDIIFPWNLSQVLLALLDEGDVGALSIFLEFHYKYRLFRWENKILSKWLDGNIDYYDEKGSLHVYPVGATFSTGSQWSNYIFGLNTTLENEDFPVGLFFGLEYWELLAPTLLSLSERDSYGVSADIIMQTWNKFLGFRTSVFVGADANNPGTLTDIPVIGFNLGMTIGSFSGSNDYFEGPGSLGSTIFAGVNTGFKFTPWEGAEAYLLIGAEGTFSLLNTFGSAEDPGKVLKNIFFHAIDSSYTLTKGTALDVGISRWETFGGPYLRAGLKF